MALSKKGQGLGFIAVLILVAILFFVFRYQNDTYYFSMDIGAERAHIMTAYTETEKAKVFVNQMLKEAGYLTLLKFDTNFLDAVRKVCNDNDNKTKFINDLTKIANEYMALYEASPHLLEVNLPNYYLQITCDATTITIEAWGHEEICLVNFSKYSYPETPCIDAQNETECGNIKYLNGSPSACVWNSSNQLSFCTLRVREPLCVIYKNKTDCESNNYCIWSVSDIELISVETAPELVDYQFSIASHAHAKIILTEEGFNAFKNKQT